ncbi:L-seryl-tRNA(Sec) selenium transferase [Synergistales bacterium]|nr:L-seryl-tRNA(Sec) selenium transferase [Synergistales bacterium]
MIEKIKQKIKTIPGMDILLEQEWTKNAQAELGRDTVKRIFNEELAKLRHLILSGSDVDVSLDSLKLTLEVVLREQVRPRLRPMLNATGVVIHTNLGRSQLSKPAIEAVTSVASSYSNLEYNLKEGVRGHRNEHIETSLCAVTGAEASLVVNNNAGAVLLCLSALSRGSEVVLSRGELVEIGGSFRIPDIMEFSGAKLVEVGTTNRTHLKDYARAIGENTSMLLKVHPSNFRMTGFTTSPSRADIASLAHERGLIFMEDAGSGLLVEGSELGLSGETDIAESLRSGVDIITFSGDKMLGGPQIGVIAGKKAIVDSLRGRPVLRALRVDKMTLAAFEATIRLYMKKSYDEIPTLAMLRRTDESMKAQAARLAAKLRKVSGGANVAVIRVDDAVGGGSCPEQPLRGWGVAVSGHPLGSAGHLASILRAHSTPILCGARDEALVLHVRTLRVEDEREIVRAFGEI